MDLQTTKPEEMLFHERTDTFDISVTLFGESKLDITLKDFVDWIIYSKQYTQEDYCKQIHKKMDMVDIYASFAQTKSQCDEEIMKEKQGQFVNLEKYVFGTVIEKEGEKLPCYKIERGGQITVYLSMLDKIKKKDVIYQSNLILNKVRDMSQKEISTEKSTNQKIQLVEGLNKKIQIQRKEKEELLKRIIIIQQQNAKLRLKTDQIQQEFKILKRQVMGIMAKNEELELKINSMKLGWEEAIISCKEELMVKNRELEQKIMMKEGEMKDRINLVKEEIAMPNPINPVTQALPQAYLNQFKTDGYKIQYTGTDNTYTHFILNSPITYNKSFTFKLKISKTKNRYIGPGVLDYCIQKDQRTSFGSGNAMCYFGSNGNRCPGGIEGDGFQEGDVVEVDVDRGNSRIRYVVNGVLKATQNHAMLADANRVFMPYIEFYTNGDLVEWLP